MDDAEVEILLKWKEYGRAVLEENKLALAELNADLAYRDALRAAGVIAADADTAATATNTAATEENAAAVEEDADAVTKQRHAYELILPVLGYLSTAVLTTLNPFNNWIKALVEAGVVLFPFIAGVTAATVITTAFATAGAGMALILGSMSIGFAAIGASAVLIANHFGFINNSMGKLKADLKEMGIDFAQSASGPANQILKFVDSLLPVVEGRGEAILSWFGARLPNALISMRVVIRDLLPELDSFGRFLGGMFDAISPAIGPMFEALTRLGIGALGGLISNLVALESWFMQRLPSYGPVVKQIFDGIGTAVQWVATQFGKLSDWFVSNWPGIQANLDAFTSGFAAAFKTMNANLGGPGSVDWTGFFNTLGAAAGGAAGIIGTAFRVLGIIISQVVAALPAALAQIVNGYDLMTNGWVNAVNNMLTAINNLPGPVKALLGISGNVPLLTYNVYPGGGGSANPVTGRAGGTQTYGAKTVTINVNGSSDPQQTAQAVSRAMRRAMSV